MAIVLINSEIGSENEVLESIRKIDAVKEAYVTYGVYDVVAKVGADSMEKLKEIITWNIRRLNKVRSTLTMIIIENKK
jgi:DNA-binding Lrp family transcriptional regulator